MDLEQFGQSFRDLRKRRGLTQEEVAERSRAYQDDRGVRKIEAGEIQPKRASVIKLVLKGLEEADPSVIDRFLELAGYEPLRSVERVRLGLAIATPPNEPSEQHGGSSTSRSLVINPKILAVWKICAIACTAGVIAGSLIVRSGFLVITAFLYAALYAISVFLESAYEFRGMVTVLAALGSFLVIWATSLAALWAENYIPNLSGLWAAIGIFMFGAAAQWLLVRPALSASPNVPAAFQALTGRTAHLKNTGYFLIFVFSFGAPPVHCIAVRNAGIAAHPRAFCPAPSLLWFLLVIYFVTSLPMAHTLLSKLRSGEYLDRFLTLFFARAIVGLFLSATCLIWYSSAMAQ